MVPLLVISMRSPTARFWACVSKYWTVPLSIRMAMRLLGLDAVPPAAAFGVTMIDSMRPKPTRNAVAAGAGAAVVAGPACGTTIVVPAAPTE